MRRNLYKQHGFSMVELMVALAIGGILLAVGLPSFQDIMAHSKMSEANNSLVYSIQLARSSSMERLEPVGLCVSNDPLPDDAVCSVGGNYNNGWIVYADTDADGVRDLNEEILDRVEPPGAAFTFTPTAAFENQIYFSDSGASINVAGVPISGTIGVDYANGIQIRQITVSANGRVTTETP